MARLTTTTTYSNNAVRDVISDNMSPGNAGGNIGQNYPATGGGNSGQTGQIPELPNKRQNGP